VRRAQLGTVVRLIGAKHGKPSMQEFPHDGHDRLPPRFASPTNPRPLLDRFSRLEKPRIQSTESHPLARVQHIGQHGEFAQNLQCAGLSDARGG
jgi:hypothetical protein